MIIIIIILIIIKTLFRCQVYLAGQRPTNWGHHLNHSKVDRDLSHDRHTHRPRYVSEGLQFSILINHLQMLEQRQDLLLNYFKTLSVGLAGNRPQASPPIDWHFTNNSRPCDNDRHQVQLAKLKPPKWTLWPCWQQALLHKSTINSSEPKCQQPWTAVQTLLGPSVTLPLKSTINNSQLECQQP